MDFQIGEQVTAVCDIDWLFGVVPAGSVGVVENLVRFTDAIDTFPIVRFNLDGFKVELTIYELDQIEKQL